jgi:hypothetical protein
MNFGGPPPAAGTPSAPSAGRHREPLARAQHAGCGLSQLTAATTLKRRTGSILYTRAAPKHPPTRTPRLALAPLTQGNRCSGRQSSEALRTATSLHCSAAGLRRAAPAAALALASWRDGGARIRGTLVAPQQFGGPTAVSTSPPPARPPALPPPPARPPALPPPPARPPALPPPPARPPALPPSHASTRCPRTRRDGGRVAARIPRMHRSTGPSHAPYRPP